MNEAEIMFASSSRERKRLFVTVDGIFKISVAGEVKFRCTNPEDAVEAYNSITEVYKDLQAHPPCEYTPDAELPKTASERHR